MSLDQLNEILKPKFMVAEIGHRPGYGLSSVAGEYEIWVYKFHSEHDFCLRHNWFSYSKDGKGLTLDHALLDACQTLNIEVNNICNHEIN